MLGHCDLDILLNPFFLHFDLTTKSVPVWYVAKRFLSLITALPKLDFTYPWRNRYRTSITAHPGHCFPVSPVNSFQSSVCLPITFTRSIHLHSVSSFHLSSSKLFLPFEGSFSRNLVHQTFDLYTLTYAVSFYLSMQPSCILHHA